MDNKDYVYLVSIGILFVLVLTGYGSKLPQDANTLLFERTTECEIEKSLHREGSTAIMNITEFHSPGFTSSKGQVHFDWSYQVSGYGGPGVTEGVNECQMNFIGEGKYSCEGDYGELRDYVVEISFNSTINPFTSKCNSFSFDSRNQ